MNIEINDKFKFASVWLTNEEKENEQIRQSIREHISEFRAKKYRFVIYESGKEDLVEFTGALLSHNKNLAIKKEKNSLQL